jgi:hypothetical protein
MSANEFYRTTQALGYGARRSEVLQLYRNAMTIVRSGSNEPFAPLNAVPTGNELGVWSTKKATGVVQVITLLYRENVTGKQIITKYQVHSAEGVTRQEAVNRAIAAYTGTTSSRGNTLIDATPSSAYRKTPAGF